MDKAGAAIARLLSIMARLRDSETGCEWDRAQTFETIAPYTIEEAYEVADAIARGDKADLRAELGDLLLQVVFHARIAEEAGAFDFSAVATAIADKMEARHPHIFSTTGATVGPDWEDLKARERASTGAVSAMDGIAKALPALMRAQKMQQRAARQGFDWPDRDGPEAKLMEEVAELRAAPDETRAEEAGDLLFAAVNLVRTYGLDAEDALRQGVRKFERRYRAMEARASGRFVELTLDQQEELWQAVKRDERL